MSVSKTELNSYPFTQGSAVRYAFERLLAGITWQLVSQELVSKMYSPQYVAKVLRRGSWKDFTWTATWVKLPNIEVLTLSDLKGGQHAQDRRN